MARHEAVSVRPAGTLEIPGKRRRGELRKSARRRQRRRFEGWRTACLLTRRLRLDTEFTGQSGLPHERSHGDPDNKSRDRSQPPNGGTTSNSGIIERVQHDAIGYDEMGVPRETILPPGALPAELVVAESGRAGSRCRSFTQPAHAVRDARRAAARHISQPILKRSGVTQTAGSGGGYRAAFGARLLKYACRRQRRRMEHGGWRTVETGRKQGAVSRQTPDAAEHRR